MNTATGSARKRRVTRAVYGLFVLVVFAFVVASTTEVAISLFGRDAEGRTDGPVVGTACAEALAREIATIDAARVRAAAEPTGDLARARYVAERGPGQIGAACEGDPNGRDALAALARLDRAAESHALRTVVELRPVRLATQSFIRGHSP